MKLLHLSRRYSEGPRIPQSWYKQVFTLYYLDIIMCILMLVLKRLEPIFEKPTVSLQDIRAKVFVKTAHKTFNHAFSLRSHSMTAGAMGLENSDA